MTTTLQSIHPVLAAKDVPASTQFYSRLGFTPLFQDSPTAPKYAMIQRDAIVLHIQWAGLDQWAYPTDRPIYRFVVSHVDALYRELMDCGLINESTAQRSPWAAPADTPWGTREFHLRDPAENSLQFYASKSE